MKMNCYLKLSMLSSILLINSMNAMNDLRTSQNIAQEQSQNTAVATAAGEISGPEVSDLREDQIADQQIAQIRAIMKRAATHTGDFEAEVPLAGQGKIKVTQKKTSTSTGNKSTSTSVSEVVIIGAEIPPELWKF